MSERQSKHGKKHHVKKFVVTERTVVPKKETPVEVLLFDPIQKERIVVEYRGESKWWFSTRMFKVYHPSFDGGTRWVMKMGRVLGPFDPNKEYPTEKDLATEARVIKRLMAQ